MNLRQNVQAVSQAAANSKYIQANDGYVFSV